MNAAEIISRNNTLFQENSVWSLPIHWLCSRHTNTTSKVVEKKEYFFRVTIACPQRRKNKITFSQLSMLMGFEINTGPTSNTQKSISLFLFIQVDCACAVRQSRIRVAPAPYLKHLINPAFCNASYFLSLSLSRLFSSIYTLGGYIYYANKSEMLMNVSLPMDLTQWDFGRNTTIIRKFNHFLTYAIERKIKLNFLKQQYKEIGFRRRNLETLFCFCFFFLTWKWSGKTMYRN